MISILIPTYNYNCSELVCELHRQVSLLSVQFEIVVADDCSPHFLTELNEIGGLSNVDLVRLEKNVGRAAIRNVLADRAKYDWLLFLDSDTMPVNDDFVSRYLGLVEKEVVVLGTTYYKDEIDKKYSLLTKYGQSKCYVDKVNKQENVPFTTANFFISKEVFSKVRFDVEINGYGHEDTVFGIELSRKGYKYLLVDNPVYHLGIDDNVEFIRKTKEAVRQLYRLHKGGRYPELKRISPLLSFYIKCESLGLVKLLAYLYRRMDRFIENKLDVENPSIRLFSIYKLLYLAGVSIQEK